MLVKKKKWRLLVAATFASASILMSSSHREAPLIADDQLADNTDVYAFRAPDQPNKICIIANYIPSQRPYDGPNYFHFGENIRYEIHIDNNINTPGDDIVYRFTFTRKNEDPTTFFNIRLGKENLKTTYNMEKSTDGGNTFSTVLQNGYIAPYNIGSRSITSDVGLGASSYYNLAVKAINHASSGEKVFCGPVDDPFFVDLGGIFDLGNAPRQNGKPLDALACKNVHTIALEINIEDLQKDHKRPQESSSILDPDFVIGVWASASRQSMTVLNDDGTQTHSGKWVQVSRLGMPLTNEAINPIGYKDYWNSQTPYDDLDNLKNEGNYYYNPELALYMDSAFFGPAIPAIFSKLKIQKNSLGSFGFGNTQDGLYSLKGTAAVEGTALDEDAYGSLLLPGPHSPRSVDIYPIFHTGVPNIRPFQLAATKNVVNGVIDPLSEGKPIINNFLPNGGDMLRLNMAVPPTQRDDPNFSTLGLLQAAVLGLTDPNYNTNNKIQKIPNMDGFPNGRRLEDDVVTIELQAVGGIVLAAIGLPYDDYFGGASVATPELLRTLSYNQGIVRNDTGLNLTFPFMQLPWSGDNPRCNCESKDDQLASPTDNKPVARNAITGKEVSAPGLVVSAYPNPFTGSTVIKYHVVAASTVNISIFNASGTQVAVLVNKKQEPGTYSVQWNAGSNAHGMYLIKAGMNGKLTQSVNISKQ